MILIGNTLICTGFFSAVLHESLVIYIHYNRALKNDYTFNFSRVSYLQISYWIYSATLDMT